MYNNRMKKLEIKKLDHQARGISYINEKIIFIENALPNEIVEIEIIEEKKKYMKGKVVNYIQKSEDRIIPNCKYYDKCGGCNLQHLSYDNQLQYKQNKIIEICKNNDIQTDIKQIIPTKQYNYRNKVTFKYNGKICLTQRNSNKFIPVENCCIADNKINEKLNELKNILLKNEVDIIIKSTDNNAILYTKCEHKKIKMIEKYDKDSNIIKINHIKYIINPESFLQVNNEGMKKLYDLIKNNCDLNHNILDLYCGSGTIGLYVSEVANKVLGIEINKQSIEDAKKNKILNQINNIEFIQGDVKDIVIKTKFKPNIIIVDPPRAGLDKTTINYLNTSKNKKLIYVSCDPMTLVRDLKSLQEYKIKSITPIDLFPNTSHIENICILERK